MTGGGSSVCEVRKSNRVGARDVLPRVSAEAGQAAEAGRHPRRRREVPSPAHKLRPRLRPGGGEEDVAAAVGG